MSEKSILLSPHEVRGVLQGRQTRITRPVKPQPTHVLREVLPPTDNVPAGGWYDWQWRGKWLYPSLCPHAPGDRLWVRETWADVGDGKAPEMFDGHFWPKYRATEPGAPVKRWRPSIHMPRWASRLTLEVTGVRVERLRDIDRQNAKDEGFWPELNGLESWNRQSYGNAQLAFEAYWKDIHGPSSWAENPFCWVYNVKRVEVEG